MKYCGLDSGKKTSHFCIINKKRKIIKEGQVSNKEGYLTKCFGKMSPMKIVIEASTKSFWIAEVIEKCGHEVIVVDPGRTKAIGAAGIKHDKLDARLLAYLCQADLLARVDRPTKKQRLDRMVVVTRDGLVKSRSRLSNMVRSILDSEGIELKKLAMDAFPDGVTKIKEEIPVEMWTAIEPILTSIQMLTEQIEDCDRRIKEIFSENREVKRLLTIPGVGIIVATCFFAAVRDTGRFKSGRDVGAYFGLVPSLYQSGQVFRRGRITKHGNRQMRWLLCIAANALLRTKQPNAIKEWGSELAKRSGRKTAVVAIARKLASVMWAMMKKETEFENRLRKAA